MSPTDQIYAKLLENRREGHALYSPRTGDVLKPGSCGYFDLQRDWQPIIQLEDNTELKKYGMTELQGVDYYTEPMKEALGTIHSDGVRRRRVEGDLFVKTPDGSVGVGASMIYESTKEQSAVLATEGLASHHQAVPGEIFRSWGTENMNAVINKSKAPDVIQEKGFWIVTKTWTVNKCAIALMQSIKSEVKFGIDVSAYNLNAAPSMDWWNSQKGSDWRALEDEQNGVVIFMSGIWWRPRKFFMGMKPIEDPGKQPFLNRKVSPMATGLPLEEGNGDTQYIQLYPNRIYDDFNLQGLSITRQSPFEVVEVGEDGDSAAESV